MTHKSLRLFQTCSLQTNLFQNSLFQSGSPIASSRSRLGPTNAVTAVTKVVMLAVMLGVIATSPAIAAPDLSEHGSVGMSSVVVASTVWTGAEVLSSVPTLSVAAVEVSAEGTVWLLRGIAEGSGQAVELSVKVAGGASLAVGTSLEVVTGTAGSLLVASGEALAFIPNELGAALFYSSTWNETLDEHHQP